MKSGDWVIKENSSVIPETTKGWQNWTNILCSRYGTVAQYYSRIAARARAAAKLLHPRPFHRKVRCLGCQWINE